MKEIKIMRTDAKTEEILSELTDVIQLFIVSGENLKTEPEHEYGDLLLSDVSDTKFGLLAKEYLNGKIISEALRLSLMNLFKHMSNNKMTEKCMIISNHEFMSSKEEIIFISILRALCYNSIVDELYTEDDKDTELTLIITNYTK